MTTTELFELDLNPITDPSTADFVVGNCKYHVPIFDLWETVNKVNVDLDEGDTQFFERLSVLYRDIFLKSDKTILEDQPKSNDGEFELSLMQTKLVHSSVSAYVARLFKKK
jgi:hypothetical protein